MWRGGARSSFVYGNDAGARTTIAGEFPAVAKKDDRGCQACFRRSFHAGAGLDPTHNLPIGIRPECNSAHHLPGEGFDLRFGPGLVLRQGHPLTDDVSALLVFRLDARSLLYVRRTSQLRPPSSM
jgi:hypothetical protein